MVLRSERFHDRVATVRGGVATRISHAMFKSAVRACSKTFADLHEARPASVPGGRRRHTVRVMGVVANHRELKACVAALAAV